MIEAVRIADQGTRGLCSVPSLRRLESHLESGGKSERGVFVLLILNISV